MFRRSVSIAPPAWHEMARVGGVRVELAVVPSALLLLPVVGFEVSVSVYTRGLSKSGECGQFAYCCTRVSR